MGLVIGIIVVVVLLLLAVFVIAGYNGLVRARNAYKNAFAQIDVQLRRRFDNRYIDTVSQQPACRFESEQASADRGRAPAGLGVIGDTRAVVDGAKKKCAGTAEAFHGGYKWS